MTEKRFSIEDSRRYWRLAPSGAGKHDTSKLASAPDGDFVADWLRGFSRRFENYLEEDFFLQTMAKEFAGKRILSVGSGLGLHEIYYAAHGAQVTCCDIVESNLSAISRMAQLLGVEASTFALGEGDRFSGRGPFDVAFLYGSLMTMPEEEQKRLLRSCAALLAPGGRIVLMLYTWEFARATCGWSSPAEFDPVAFARASDESVGEEHCPWSDWHDDAKLLTLAPPGFSIARRQFWQQGWFAWYELAADSTARPRAFFDMGSFLRSGVREVLLREFSPAAATLAVEGQELRVRTEANLAGYAAISPPLPLAGENALALDAEIIDGAFSVGVLDEAANAFVASHAVRGRGRQSLFLAIPSRHEAARIVLSNFRDAAASSEFSVSRVALARAERASLIFAEEVRRRIAS